MKIKSSDDHEFVVEVEEVNEMETLKTMVNFADEVEEEVPTCAIKGTSLEKVLVWTKYQNYFKNMDLKDIFDAIISADYLENKRIFKKMLKKVFLNNSAKDIDEAVNSMNMAQLSDFWMISRERMKLLSFFIQTHSNILIRSKAN